jgi:hypothetical protein
MRGVRVKLAILIWMVPDREGIHHPRVLGNVAFLAAMAL